MIWKLWMASRMAATSLVIAPLALSSLLTASLTAQGSISVGENVMVSASSPGWAHAEYAADADPAVAGRAMVCSMRFSPEKNQLTSVLYLTDDGGKHWRLALEDSVSRFNGVWDPACAYGLGNQTYLVTLILPDTAQSDRKYSHHQYWRVGGDNNMHVHRSFDAGKTWQPPVMLSFIDYESISVDRTNSQYRGRIYIYGNTTGNGAWLVYSPDSGKSWIRSERNEEDDFYARTGTILPSGVLLMPFNKTPRGIMNMGSRDSASLTVAATRDGGVHIEPSVNVARFTGNCSRPLGIGMASDHSSGPFKGRAYVVWADVERGRCLPHIAWSDDEGKTWSKPVIVSDALPRPNVRQPTEHILAKVAVNSAGVVGVSWFDPGEDTTNSNIQLRFSASLDGGRTWMPSARVSSHGFEVRSPPDLAAISVIFGGGSRAYNWGGASDAIHFNVQPAPRAYFQSNSNPGDYSGIAADADGSFHTFWVDNRSGFGEMYTSRLTVSGRVARSDSAISSLTNVTSAIELQATSSMWDPFTKTMSWTIQLMNTSKDTIVGPLRMEASEFRSGTGGLRIVADDGTEAGWSAIFDVSDLLTDGKLLPGQTSKTRKLKARLDIVPDGPPSFDINMTVKFFGTRKPEPTPAKKSP